mgnify:CR=1 FL=1
MKTKTQLLCKTCLKQVSECRCGGEAGALKWAFRQLIVPEAFPDDERIHIDDDRNLS